MKVDLQNLNLYKLILTTFTLDEFESSYLCPLLEQTGLYSGYSEIILTAHKISHKVQDVSYLKKEIQKKIKDKSKDFEKKNYVHHCTELTFLSRQMNVNYGYISIEYNPLYFFSEKYFLQAFSYRYFYQLLQPTFCRFHFNFTKQDFFEENVVTCLILILLYKVWKTTYWYPLISKIAFDCKEIKIAKYFVQLANLEYKMIYMLAILFA